VGVKIMNREGVRDLRREEDDLIINNSIHEGWGG